MLRPTGQRRAAALIGLSCLLLAGCATTRQVAQPVATVAIEAIDPNSWPALITPSDNDRLRRIGDAWKVALAQATPRNATAIAREGALLDPDGALTRPAPPPGTYHCRVVALGTTPPRRGKAFAAFRPFTCFVVAEDKLLVLMKANGSELPGGRLWEDGDKRLIFLGSLAGSPGAAAPAYAAHPQRDRAGVVERVGDFRWRMVMPWVADGTTLSVMELVPDTPQAASAAERPRTRRAS